MLHPYDVGGPTSAHSTATTSSSYFASSNYHSTRRATQKPIPAPALTPFRQQPPISVEQDNNFRDDDAAAHKYFVSPGVSRRDANNVPIRTWWSTSANNIDSAAEGPALTPQQTSQQQQHGWAVPPLQSTVKKDHKYFEETFVAANDGAVSTNQSAAPNKLETELTPTRGLEAELNESAAAAESELAAPSSDVSSVRVPKRMAPPPPTPLRENVVSPPRNQVVVHGDEPSPVRHQYFVESPSHPVQSGGSMLSQEEKTTSLIDGSANPSQHHSEERRRHRDANSSEQGSVRRWNVWAENEPSVGSHEEVLAHHQYDHHGEQEEEHRSVSNVASSSRQTAHLIDKTEHHSYNVDETPLSSSSAYKQHATPPLSIRRRPSETTTSGESDDQGTSQMRRPASPPLSGGTTTSPAHHFHKLLEMTTASHFRESHSPDGMNEELSVQRMIHNESHIQQAVLGSSNQNSHVVTTTLLGNAINPVSSSSPAPVLEGKDALVLNQQQQMQRHSYYYEAEKPDPIAVDGGAEQTTTAAVTNHPHSPRVPPAHNNEGQQHQYAPVETLAGSPFGHSSPLHSTAPRHHQQQQQHITSPSGHLYDQELVDSSKAAPQQHVSSVKKRTPSPVRSPHAGQLGTTFATPQPDFRGGSAAKSGSAPQQGSPYEVRTASPQPTHVLNGQTSATMTLSALSPIALANQTNNNTTAGFGAEGNSPLPSRIAAGHPTDPVAARLLRASSSPSMARHGVEDALLQRASSTYRPHHQQHRSQSSRIPSVSPSDREESHEQYFDKNQGGEDDVFGLVHEAAAVPVVDRQPTNELPSRAVSSQPRDELPRLEEKKEVALPPAPRLHLLIADAVERLEKRRRKKIEAQCSDHLDALCRVMLLRFELVRNVLMFEPHERDAIMVAEASNRRLLISSLGLVRSVVDSGIEREQKAFEAIQEAESRQQEVDGGSTSVQTKKKSSNEASTVTCLTPSVVASDRATILNLYGAAVAHEVYADVYTSDAHSPSRRGARRKPPVGGTTMYEQRLATKQQRRLEQTAESFVQQQQEAAAASRSNASGGHHDHHHSTNTSTFASVPEDVTFGVFEDAKDTNAVFPLLVQTPGTTPQQTRTKGGAPQASSSPVSTWTTKKAPRSARRTIFGDNDEEEDHSTLAADEADALTPAPRHQHRATPTSTTKLQRTTIIANESQNATVLLDDEEADYWEGGRSTKKKERSLGGLAVEQDEKNANFTFQPVPIQRAILVEDDDASPSHPSSKRHHKSSETRTPENRRPRGNSGGRHQNEELLLMDTPQALKGIAKPDGEAIGGGSGAATPGMTPSSKKMTSVAEVLTHASSLGDGSGSGGGTSVKKVVRNTRKSNQHKAVATLIPGAPSSPSPLRQPNATQEHSLHNQPSPPTPDGAGVAGDQTTATYTLGSLTLDSEDRRQMKKLDGTNSGGSGQQVVELSPPAKRRVELAVDSSSNSSDDDDLALPMQSNVREDNAAQPTRPAPSAPSSSVQNTRSRSSSTSSSSSYSSSDSDSDEDGKKKIEKKKKDVEESSGTGTDPSLTLSEDEEEGRSSTATPPPPKIRRKPKATSGQEKDSSPFDDHEGSNW